MMQPGTIQDAVVLAQQRWTERHSFDIAPETWQEIFEQYRPGEILQAIAKTKGTRNPAPEVVYQNLLYWLARLEKERHQKNPTWPPFDVDQQQD